MYGLMFIYMYTVYVKAQFATQPISKPAGLLRNRPNSFPVKGDAQLETGWDRVYNFETGWVDRFEARWR